MNPCGFSTPRPWETAFLYVGRRGSPSGPTHILRVGNQPMSSLSCTPLSSQGGHEPREPLHISGFRARPQGRQVQGNWGHMLGCCQQHLAGTSLPTHWYAALGTCELLLLFWAWGCRENREAIQIWPVFFLYPSIPPRTLTNIGTVGTQVPVSPVPGTACASVGEERDRS